MELNQELKDMYEKLKDVSVNDLGGFIDTSNSSFQSLNSSIGDTLSSVSIGDGWDDDIKLELNNVTYNGINNIIASCSEVITNVCTPLGTKVPNLVTELSNYLKEYENYETALENRGKVNIGSEPVLGDYDSEESYRTAHNLWSSRNSQYDGYTSAMTIAERNASRYEKNALQDITAIKELLSDAIASNQSVPSGSDTPRLHSDTDTKKDKDGNTINTTNWYDEDGNLVETTYQKIDPDGNVIEVGDVTLDENGKPITRSSIISTEDYTEEVKRFYEGDKLSRTVYDTSFTDGSKTTFDITYWLETGKIRTTDYDHIYGDPESYLAEFNMHTEYDQDGTRTASTSRTVSRDGVTNIKESIIENGEYVGFVSIDVDKEGNVKCVSTFDYQFDENGEKTGFTSYSEHSDGKKSAMTFVTIKDENGDDKSVLKESVYYNADGSISKNTVGETTSSGEPLTQECENYNADGVYTGKKKDTYTYGEDGSHSRTSIDYDENGKFKSGYIFQYDAKGHLECIRCDSQGNPI